MTRTAIVNFISFVLFTSASPAVAGTLAGQFDVPGGAVDFSPGTGVNDNRLGGFGSDLAYDRVNNVYYGLVDRGPGGGPLEFRVRMQQFALGVDPANGTLSNFELQETIYFKNADGSAE